MKQTSTDVTGFAAWRTGYSRPESRLLSARPLSVMSTAAATSGIKPNIHVCDHAMNVRPRRGALLQ